MIPKRVFNMVGFMPAANTYWGEVAEYRPSDFYLFLDPKKILELIAVEYVVKELVHSNRGFGRTSISSVGGVDLKLRGAMTTFKPP